MSNVKLDGNTDRVMNSHIQEVREVRAIAQWERACLAFLRRWAQFPVPKRWDHFIALVLDPSKSYLGVKGVIWLL